jgi:N-acetylneuraminate synthase
MSANNIFYNLFILELANNHWGSVERGRRIINSFAQVVRFNNVRAAIKLQFRDGRHFVQPDFKGREDIRYIKKTEATVLKRSEYGTLIQAIRDQGCIPMATAFDEASVDLCEDFDLPIIKVASSDLNDWFLLERIAKTRRPVIVSTGGSSEKDVDDLVAFFGRRNIPLAINHCVSLYPTEDRELELNQIDYLRQRYPQLVVGYSTHEYNDWQSSVMITYAKGARTWERHIDIDADGIPVSPYCSLPHQVDTWFKAFHRAREMCGASGDSKRIPQRREIEYLDSLVRGVYVKRDLPSGYEFHHGSADSDFYLAIPLQKGQLSCREIMNGQRALRSLKAESPLMIDDVDSPYASNTALRELAMSSGIAKSVLPMAMHDFLAEDLASIGEPVLVHCRLIEGMRIYVSGATGFFGKNLLALFAYLHSRGLRFKVTALSRVPERFLAEQPTYRECPWLDWLKGDVLQPWPGEGRYDCVLHAATGTAAAEHVDKLAVFEGILAGSRNALGFAAARGATRVLLCGSGAQYGKIPSHLAAGIPEDSPIACDAAKIFSAYGEAKRASETLAALYAARHGFAVINTRCFAFVGPGLALDGHFAVGHFLRAALLGKTIELTSTGTAVRSYLYSADLAVWLMSLLLNAPAGSTVNVGSPQRTTILELANRVRDLVRPDLQIRVGATDGGGERENYLPSIEMARSFGLDVWTALERSITRTARWHRQGFHQECL